MATTPVPRQQWWEDLWYLVHALQVAVPVFSGSTISKASLHEEAGFSKQTKQNKKVVTDCVYTTKTLFSELPGVYIPCVKQELGLTLCKSGSCCRWQWWCLYPKSLQMPWKYWEWRRKKEQNCFILRSGKTTQVTYFDFGCFFLKWDLCIVTLVQWKIKDKTWNANCVQNSGTHISANVSSYYCWHTFICRRLIASLFVSFKCKKMLMMFKLCTLPC